MTPPLLRPRRTIQEQRAITRVAPDDRVALAKQVAQQERDAAGIRTDGDGRILHAPEWTQ